jgi:hypothetical protein
VEEVVIKTPWGRVVIELHEHQAVEKYLVIRKGGSWLSRRTNKRPLTVEALAPGDRFHFEPGMEHCIIGTENLLVFERSVDPKGMDQDLVFIYEPDAPREVR